MAVPRASLSIICLPIIFSSARDVVYINYTGRILRKRPSFWSPLPLYLSFLYGSDSITLFLGVPLELEVLYMQNFFHFLDKFNFIHVSCTFFNHVLSKCSHKGHKRPSLGPRADRVVQTGLLKRRKGCPRAIKSWSLDVNLRLLP